MYLLHWSEALHTHMQTKLVLNSQKYGRVLYRLLTVYKPCYDNASGDAKLEREINWPTNVLDFSGFVSDFNP